MRLKKMVLILCLFLPFARPAFSAVVSWEWQIGIRIEATTTITASATITPTLANTATITPTATITRTLTVTQTPTITPTGIPVQLWQEEFFYSDDDPPSVPGSQPPEWCDESEDANHDAEIVYSTSDGLAEISLNTGAAWGKVVSWHREVNVDLYPYLQINVSQINSGRLCVGVFRQPWEEHLAVWIESPGIYQYDIRELTGWNGIQSQAGVEIVLEGINASVEVDTILISGYILPTSTVTLTPTVTPILTPTQTPIPTSTPAATQPVNTSTPTQTPTPYVTTNTVLPYPNPARDRVNFAYTVFGPGKVKIDIYKLTGERVASITEQVNGGTGQTLSTAWDAVDVAPGIYFCRIVITDGSGNVILDQKKKVALIK